MSWAGAAGAGRGIGREFVHRLAILWLVAGCFLHPAVAAPSNTEFAAWAQRAQRVTIVRDEWGIPHVEGKTDADAVFGLIYAQAEDDFNRIEMNYLNALGRTAEAEGEKQVFHDLRMRLVSDESDLRAQYAAAPAWLRELMDAWADGINFFLATHPEVQPRVLTRFEPWMTLAFSEGSIGWDIESVSLPGLEAFYGTAGKVAALAADAGDGQRGSNGIAIAGKLSRSQHALLLINPHTSFFFRAEAHVRSAEGLDAYGAVTWGQFFIYQGFNERLGWMHTSTGADFLDEYAETITRGADGHLTYVYAGKERPLTRRTVTIRYRTADRLQERKFDVLGTHHGPIVREEQGKWIAVRLMNDPVHALMQSYLRTKTRDLAAFRSVLNLHTNSSNNTVYADADGNIAYFHANHVARRDRRFDWSRPVDGSDPATEWQGIHTVDESPNVVNPGTGWIQNNNNWPYSVAGSSSPNPADFPAYMDQVGENARGVHAVRVLSDRKDFTLDSLVGTAYDSALPAFDVLLPPLFEAHDALAPGHELRARLGGPIQVLRSWDRRWALDSVATTVAVYWAEELWRTVNADPRGRSWQLFERVATSSTQEQRLQALAAATDRLQRDFGDWRTPWGQVNRLQRLTADIVQRFDDAADSVPVPFTSGRWGSLAAFEAEAYPGTVRRYGTKGNSFVAAVEFGPRIRARAIMVGGQSGQPASAHFFDQAARYAQGALRDIHFYPGDVAKHAVVTYRPGDARR